MDRRRRNRILLGIILLGLANFIAYTLSYWILQGDARNGAIIDGHYYLRGHFIHDRGGHMTEAVSRGVWVYSYLHSISIWPTIGMVLVSMLILARPHIIATMGDGRRLNGASFIGAAAVLIVLITGAYTLHFFLDFREALSLASQGIDYGVVN